MSRAEYQRNYRKNRVAKGLCRECGNETQGKLRCSLCIKKLIKYVIKYNAKTDKQSKVKVYNHYGNKCSCCGEDDFRFLTIDHMNNDGNRHRKRYGTGRFYYWICSNNYPTDLQILCWNCNCAKGVYGQCPHNL